MKQVTPIGVVSTRRIEGINKGVKRIPYFQKKTSPGKFWECFENVSWVEQRRQQFTWCNQERNIVFKTWWSKEYEWLKMNKANSNYVWIQVKKDIKILQKDVSTIYAVKSSNTPLDVMLKDFFTLQHMNLFQKQ